MVLDLTECYGERLVVAGDYDGAIPAPRRAVSRVASQHSREGLPGSPEKRSPGS